MNITLRTRTEDSVRTFFDQSRKETILKNLPMQAQTVEEALEAYNRTLQSDASSYGRIILVDDVYIGDVWCYGMNKSKSPGAMLSICIFDEASWGKGIATQAVLMFLNEIRKKFGIQSFGAFVYADHTACVRVLEKNGFRFVEEFTEDGRPSRFYQKRF